MNNKEHTPEVFSLVPFDELKVLNHITAKMMDCKEIVDTQNFTRDDFNREFKKQAMKIIENMVRDFVEEYEDSEDSENL